MSKKAFEKIMAGAQDALAHTRTVVTTAIFRVEQAAGRPHLVADFVAIQRLAKGFGDGGAEQHALCLRNAPVHAHHLRFAQPRAMNNKVSDEWSVPLCFTHHRACTPHHRQRGRLVG
jgi:hypothetical protein